MKKIINAGKICIVVLLFLSLLTACANSEQENVKTNVTEEVVIIDETAEYAYYSTYEEAFDRADVVVYGKIKEIKEAIPTNSNLKSTRTPIVIDIIEKIKGEYTDNEIVYHALGGKVDNILYKSLAYSTEELSVGTEIVVFLRYSERSDYYYNISPNYYYYGDESGSAYIYESMLPMPSYSNKYDEEGKMKLSDYAYALKERYLLTEK